MPTLQVATPSGPVEVSQAFPLPTASTNAAVPVLGVQGQAVSLQSSTTTATIAPAGYAPVTYSAPASTLVGTLTVYASFNGTTFTTATTFVPTGGTAVSSIALSGGANSALSGGITLVPGAVAYQIQATVTSGSMAVTLTAGMTFDAQGNLNVRTFAGDSPTSEDNPDGVTGIAVKPTSGSSLGITPTSTLMPSSGVGGIKNAAGNVYGLMLTNIDSTAHYIFLVATNTPAQGSAAVVSPIIVPPTSTIVVTFPIPVQLPAIGIADMTTSAGGTLQTNQKVYYTPFFK